MKGNSQRTVHAKRARKRKRQQGTPRWLIPSVLVVAALVATGIVIASISGGPPSGSGDTSDTLSVGDPAPAFALPQAGGGEYSLAEDLKEGPVLLYFSMAGRR